VKRALAILVAVGLVALGFLVRGMRDDGPGPGSPEPGGGTTAVGVVCDTTLDTVCEALSAGGLDVRREAAATTVDRLATLADPGAVGDGPAPDVWVTIAPWPAIVDEARTRGGLSPLFDPSPGEAAIASSPLVLVGWSERDAVLRIACDRERIDWDCVGQAAGARWVDLGGSDTWGPFKPGFDDPRRSSLGLTVLGNATAHELGRNDFGTRELTSPAYLDWLRGLAEAVPDFAPTAGSALDAMLLTGPASYDVTATTEAAARTALETSVQRGAQLEVTYLTVPAAPDTAVVLDVVVARRPGVEVDTVVADVAAAAASAGWHTVDATPTPVGDDGVAPPSAPSASPGATLPAAGALTALRTSFAETYRR
jgi:hypothetical protein